MLLQAVYPGVEDDVKIHSLPSGFSCCHVFILIDAFLITSVIAEQVKISLSNAKILASCY
jgi:hypothetical protein